jgi:endonuclease/exonuclease/phosphatase family metal-dependent hydrolase
LAPAGAALYDNLAPLTEAEYDAKMNWSAQQLDLLDADVIGFQEVFSQASLADLLARTERYRDAEYVGFDPDPARRLTPSVALVSRLPLVGPALARPRFPDGVALPPGNRDSTTFSRPVLHAQIMLPGSRIVDVLVVHLKSRWPDYSDGDDGNAAAEPDLLHAMANLRSLIRRGTEAVALRVMLSKLRRSGGRPCIVMGDFNDVLDAVTTSIVLGADVSADGAQGDEFIGRMFDSNRIKSHNVKPQTLNSQALKPQTPLHQQDIDPLAYTCLHEGRVTTIDHILVSEEFHRASPRSIGEVLDVVYLNRHLQQSQPGASDHGQVLARIRLRRSPAEPDLG